MSIVVPGPLTPLVGAARLVRRHRRRKTKNRVAAAAERAQTVKDLAVLAALAKQSGANADEIKSLLGGKTPARKPLARRVYVRCGGHRALGSAAAVGLGLDLTWILVHYVPGGLYVSLGKAVVALAWMVGGVLWVSRVGGGPVRRLSALGVTVVSALWVGLPVGPVDLPGRWELFFLVLGSALACRGWHFRVRPVTEETRQARQPRQADQARVWDEYLGAERKALAGTRLEGLVVEDTSWTATVVCPRDSRGAQTVVAARANIATAYGVNPLWVDVITGDDNSAPQVVVTTEATLAESRAWTPDGVTATTVEVATRPDGTRVTIEVQDPASGVRHAWFTGGSGSGKTGAVIGTVGRIMQPHQPTLDATGERTGWVVLDLVDLGETSLPALAAEGVRFRFGTTVEDARLALRRAVAVMESRQRAMRSMTTVDRGVERTGVSTLQVCPAYPLYLLLVEEATVLVDDKEAMRLADQIAKLGRKYGVAIMWVTQTCNINESFGHGHEAIRRNIQSNGSVFAGWSPGASGQMAFGGGVQFNLAEIPKGQPGTGLWVTQTDSRVGVARTDWIDDNPARPDHVPSTWQVADTICPGVLEEAAARAVDEVEAAAEAELDLDGGGSPCTVVPGPGAGPSTGDRRALVARIVEELGAAGEPVPTRDVMVEYLSRTGQAQLLPSAPEWGRQYDLLLKDLGQVAVKSGRGRWERRAA